MKKFIKINFIILVIFCLSCNFALIKINATSDEIQEEINEEETSEENTTENNDENEEKTLDDLQIERTELENQINSSNEQIQFIESDLSATVAEISDINQKIIDKQMEIETLQVQEKDLVVYIDKAEKELEISNVKYEKH